MYGSMAQGLAIETSDLDLSILGLKCGKIKEGKRLTTIYSNLLDTVDTNILEKMDCITETDYPVLKLTFSTDGLESEYCLDKPDPEYQISHISVDMTIIDAEEENLHFGIDVRNFVR